MHWTSIKIGHNLRIDLASYQPLGLGLELGLGYGLGLGLVRVRVRIRVRVRDLFYATSLASKSDALWDMYNWSIGSLY